jgi:hypothetical protein
MTSWRDTTSESAQVDLDSLLDVVLPAAEALLRKHGEFYPFGATVSAQGEVALSAADPHLGEHPASNDVLASLYAGVRANASTARAAGFVADVRVDGSDAIRLELEHHEGVALVVLLPYGLSRFKKSLTLGQMSVSRSEPRIWAST